MPFIEDSLMTWEECGDLIKVDIQRLDSAIRAGEEIALDDSFPIRSLLSTFNGYGPSGVDRLEDILGVTEEFRLAVCLEHSLSLVICSLVQLYYVDRNLVYELDEKWADIKAAQSMLKTLVTFVTSYQRHFEVYGPKYEEVRRGCDEIYLAWNALRARRPEPIREVFLEAILMEPGVVLDMGTELHKIRTNDDQDRHNESGFVSLI